MEAFMAINTFLATAIITATMINPVRAEVPAATVGSLPPKGTVALSGTVEKVKSERIFTLRDSSGSIDVDIAADEAVVLEPGNQVRVIGNLRPGLFHSDFKARRIELEPNISPAFSNAVESADGLSTVQARRATVSDLPQPGIVRLTGNVKKIKSERSFTLGDATGEIDVSLERDQHAMLSRGSEVTVMGYARDGLFGKEIEATRLIVLPGGTRPAAAGNWR
jgi:uncharacterized protein YdeI (BOF family)